MKTSRTLFRVTMQLDNHAFAGDRIDRAMEVARILRELADDITNHATLVHDLRDINGNRVGTTTVRVERR